MKHRNTITPFYLRFIVIKVIKFPVLRNLLDTRWFKWLLDLVWSDEPPFISKSISPFLLCSIIKSHTKFIFSRFFLLSPIIFKKKTCKQEKLLKITWNLIYVKYPSVKQLLFLLSPNICPYNVNLYHLGTENINSAHVVTFMSFYLNWIRLGFAVCDNMVSNFVTTELVYIY